MKRTCYGVRYPRLKRSRQSNVVQQSKPDEWMNGERGRMEAALQPSASTGWSIALEIDNVQIPVSVSACSHKTVNFTVPFCYIKLFSD